MHRHSPFSGYGASVPVSDSERYLAVCRMLDQLHVAQYHLIDIGLRIKADDARADEVKNDDARADEVKNDDNNDGKLRDEDLHGENCSNESSSDESDARGDSSSVASFESDDRDGNSQYERYLRLDMCLDPASESSSS